MTIPKERHRDIWSRPALRRLVLSVSIALLTACAASKPKPPAPSPATTAATNVAAEAEETFTTPARTPIIVEGTGNFIGTPRVATATQAPRGDGGYQLNFIDTEIASVVASVIGDGLGLPYVVDPEVKGTMTLQAARPLTRDEVLPALEAALNVHGVAMIEANGVFQIVLNKEARRRVAALRAPDQQAGTGFGIQIVPVKYVSVADLEKILRPFAGDNGILHVDEARNLLLLAGSSRDLEFMRDVVNTFDVNWLQGMSFGLYPVEYVDAKTIADELGTIFSDPKSPIGNVVRLVPLSRLNSLMVVTRQPSYLKDVEAWIKRLDAGVTTPGRRIYVYDVQNGKADDLANSLNKILSIASGDSGDGAAASSTSSIFDSDGDSLFRSSSQGMGGQRPNATGDDTTAAVPSVSAASDTPGVLKIVPNPENNAILTFATPSEYAVIERALRRLDVLPFQVLIEASLAEVTLTDDLRYGLQWSYQSGEGPIVLSEASNGAVSPKFPGFSYLFTGSQDIRAVLNAIESVTDVNVISSPKLLVLNNREAELQIGDQVPITVQSSVSTVDDTAPIVNSVQMRDTGVILRITPRVNKSGLVLLDIAQEVSDVVPTTSSSIDSPTIQQRRIASTIAVRTGETIALGGLIRDSRSVTRSGVPYLQKIPLVGELFASSNKNKRRTELIVLITPKVLRSHAETDSMMEDLREQFRRLEKVIPEWREQQVKAERTGETQVSKTEAAAGDGAQTR